MNKMIKPALMVMASLALAAPSFGADAAGAAASGADPDITAVAKKVYPSVVRVEVRNHTRRVATGVVIEKGGYVVTTALVSPHGEEISVTTSEGKILEAEFLGFDTETQLALLRARDAGLPALGSGKAADLAPGSWVCVVGVSPERTAAVTQGIVSSAAEDKLRLNVWVTPGSSGSPVVDENGRMVGLLRGVYAEERPVVFQFRDREQAGSGLVLSSRGEAPSSGMALAVPIEVVRDVVGQIKEKGRVERGWLGVSIGQDERGRTVIGAVDKESPAELADLRAGDIVLEIAGRAVTSPDVLAAEVRRRKPGQQIALKIERDGRPLDVKARLGELAEDEAMREMTLRFPGLFERAVPLPGAPEVEPKRVMPQPLLPREWTFETRKYIGVYCAELNRELAEHFGVKEGTALMISRLTEDGPAAKAKLRVGDIILRVDGGRVGTVNELIDRVQAKAEGETLKLEVLRDKKALTFEVEVAEEESGAPLESEGLRDFLESWQDYTKAFQGELRNWRSDDPQWTRQLLRGLALKGNLRRI
ncbi:MAG TPA: PDZ domain-containing protein [Candidatus Aminicenantes bacterium]|nr:PDZ domain-containing protein [Candidatus Aminicenantes bacterium]HDT13350.1 PDZ domain-containing protein [Candidatus Aminicenantes bacterium]